MDFLKFVTNYKQDHRLQNAIKFDLLVWPTFEIISDFSMHNVYWDTLYIQLIVVVHILVKYLQTGHRVYGQTGKG